MCGGNQVIEEPLTTTTTVQDTTTTTVQSLQNTPEEEMQSNINFKLPDSDGVDIYSSKISIYSTKEQALLIKIIPGISLEKGCIKDDIENISSDSIKERFEANE